MGKQDRDQPESPPLCLWLRWVDWCGRALGLGQGITNPLVRQLTGVSSRRLAWEDALLVVPLAALTLMEMSLFVWALGIRSTAAPPSPVIRYLLDELIFFPTLFGGLVGVASLRHAQATLQQVPLSELVRWRMKPTEIVSGLWARPVAVIYWYFLLTPVAFMIAGLVGLVVWVFLRGFLPQDFPHLCLACFGIAIVFGLRALHTIPLAEFAAANAVRLVLEHGNEAHYWSSIWRPLLLGVRSSGLILGGAAAFYHLNATGGPTDEWVLWAAGLMAIPLWLAAIPLEAALRAVWIRRACAWTLWRAGSGSGPSDMVSPPPPRALDAILDWLQARI